MLTLLAQQHQFCYVVRRAIRTPEAPIVNFYDYFVDNNVLAGICGCCCNFTYSSWFVQLLPIWLISFSHKLKALSFPIRNAHHFDRNCDLNEFEGTQLLILGFFASNEARVVFARKRRPSRTREEMEGERENNGRKENQGQRG